MPGLWLLCLWLWNEPTVFTAWLLLTLARGQLVSRWHAATVLLLLHVGQKLGILQELLGDAHAISFDVAAGLMHHATLIEPPNHFLTR